MKTKHFYSFLALVATTSAVHAQVGINTPTPQTTLDIVGNGANTTIKDGIMPPRVTKQQLASKAAGTYASSQNGALIYVTDITAPSGVTPSLVQVANINAAGYYYFDGVQWTASTPTDINIYNSNGTLSSTRTVTQNANTLAFNGSAVNSFSVNNAAGTTNILSADATNSRVGIGTTAPAAKLDIVGTVFGIKNAIGSGSWDNMWFNILPSNPSINVSGAETGLQFNVGANVTGTYGDGQTLTTVATMAPSGNMGVGITAPTNKLHVNGTDPLRLSGLTAGNTTTDQLLVIDPTGVVKNISTLGGLSIPNPAIFRLDTQQTNFLNGVGAGSSSVVPMSVVKNTIPGMTYNTGTSTITFPAGTYQMTFMYEATHDNTPGACAISSYIVDFPLASGTARVHSTAAHNIGGLSNHGGTITYAPTLPAGTTWQIRLGRGQSGSCSGTGMTLFASSTLLLVFRIGD